MAATKYLQRVGGLVRLKPDSNRNSFELASHLEFYRDDLRDIERGSLGLYISFRPENDIKRTCDCEILLFGDQLFAIPSVHFDKWFEVV